MVRRKLLGHREVRFHRGSYTSIKTDNTNPVTDDHAILALLKSSA